jgi:hypothetical protein
LEKEYRGKNSGDKFMTDDDRQERESEKQDPTLVFRTWQRTEAEMIKAILEKHGIQCMLSSDITHSVYPFTMDGLGEIRIYVPKEQVSEAQHIIEVFSGGAKQGEGEDKNPET